MGSYDRERLGRSPEAKMSSQSAPSIGPAFVHEADTLRIRSRHVAADFEIRVARPLPALMSPLPMQYQVLYVLDGDLFFGLATDMTRLMHRLFVELPPIFVVGIGYGAADGRVFNEMRNRDFTPTANAGVPIQEPPIPSGPDPLVPEAQRYGGAGRFLDFLLDELKPLITARYPLATGRSTLVGSSMGGLFASYVLLEKPDSFDEYIIASPALWWDDGLLLRTAAQRPLLRGNAPARVFLAVGALEQGAGILKLDAFRLISNTREFARQLQDRPGSALDVRMHVFDAETHTSVVPTAITRGLRMLCGQGTYVRPLP